MPDVFAALPPALVRKLDELDGSYRDLEAKLGDPAVLADHRAVREVSIKKAALEPVVEGYRRFRALSKEAEELRAAASGGDDPEFAAMARAELPEVEAKAGALLDEVKSALVTSDDRKVGSVMLEVRAGTGGDEAALWARDLIDMYSKYAAKKGWVFEVLDLTAESDAGGVRNAVINVRGPGVWTELAFEAGVHSV
jgi:peptide chain release factor 1